MQCPHCKNEFSATVYPHHLGRCAEAPAKARKTAQAAVPSPPATPPPPNTAIEGANPILAKMTNAELKKYAADNDIELGDATLKKDLVAAIEAAEENAE